MTDWELTNNKSYVTKDIKKVINTRKVAFKNNDSGALKLTEKELKIRLKEAKLAHSLWKMLLKATTLKKCGTQ